MTPTSWREVFDLFDRLHVQPTAQQINGLQQYRNLNPSNGIADEVEKLLLAHDNARTSFIQISHHEPAKFFSTHMILGKFKIEKILQQSALSEVCLAFDQEIQRKVVLKIARNLAVESQIMARLRHQNIVQIFSVETIGSPCDSQSLKMIAMEYIDGVTLDVALTRLNCTPLDFLTKFIADVSSAMSYAHAMGVLHLDLKPQNILYCEKIHRFSLLDFNVSYHHKEPGQNKDASQTVISGGTFGFMSPEQELVINGADASLIGPACDLYSFGKVLELLAKTLSFDAQTSEWLKLLTSYLCQPEAAIRLNEFSTVVEILNEFKARNRLQQAISRVNVDYTANTSIQFLSASSFLKLFLAIAIPNSVMSVLQINYNFIEIIPHLTGTQRIVFSHLLMPWNAFIYIFSIVCALIYHRQVIPGIRSIYKSKVSAHNLMHRDAITAIDRQIYNVGNFLRTFAIMTVAGWAAGLLLFTGNLSTIDQGLPFAVIVHFIISFFASGALALIYTDIASRWVMLHFILPELLSINSLQKTEWRALLGHCRRRISTGKILAGILPLGSLLLIVFNFDVEPNVDQISHFKVLIISLGILSALGFYYTTKIVDRMLDIATTFENQSSH